MSNAWPQEEDEVLTTVLNLVKAGRISENWPKELNNAPEEAKILWSRRNQLGQSKISDSFELVFVFQIF
jgi:hypothetical protein